MWPFRRSPALLDRASSSDIEVFRDGTSRTIGSGPFRSMEPHKLEAQLQTIAQKGTQLDVAMLKSLLETMKDAYKAASQHAYAGLTDSRKNVDIATSLARTATDEILRILESIAQRP